MDPNHSLVFGSDLIPWVDPPQPHVGPSQLSPCPVLSSHRKTVEPAQGQDGVERNILSLPCGGQRFAIYKALPHI